MTFGDADLTLRLAIGAVLALSALTLAFMGYSFVLHLRSLGAERRRRALDEAWRGRLLEAATREQGAADEPDEAGGSEPVVPDRDRVLFLELVTSYARALEGPEREALERFGRPYLSALDPLLSDRDPYRRAYALDILGELGYAQGRARLAAGLADDSALVAMIAARALARRGDPDYFDLLVQRLPAFEDWSTSYLVNLLVQFGPPIAPALRALAQHDAAPSRTRSVAVLTLERLHDLPSVALALGMLPQEPDPELQSDLIELIGSLGRPEDLPTIRPFARSSAAHVRAAAIRAVAELSDRRTSDVELVAEGLDDASPWVALHAAHGLFSLGQSDELRALANSSSPRAELAAEVLETRG